MLRLFQPSELHCKICCKLAVRHEKECVGFRMKGSAGVITIPGFTHPVRDLFLEDALEQTGFVVGRGSKWAAARKPAAVAPKVSIPRVGAALYSLQHSAMASGSLPRKCPYLGHARPLGVAVFGAVSPQSCMSCACSYLDEATASHSRRSGHHMQEAADKLAAYAGYSGKRAARDAAAPDAWDAEEAPESEVEFRFPRA